MDKFSGEKSIVIAVAGGAGAGKTTFSRQLVALLKNYSVILISVDNYCKDFSHLTLKQRKQINFDNPNTIDIELLSKHLKMLKNNQSVNCHYYDYSISLRSKKTFKLNPAKIIIIEGVLLLSTPKIRELSDIKIYIETDDDLRFIRRLKRDINERKRSREFAINQYLTMVKPMHELIVKPSSRYADLIIPYYDGNNIAMNILIKSIEGVLKNGKKN